ncbi:prion-inhibition and propagation-domain-containing protein [Hypoxylon sp. FL1857]|nr:prion-inhibition and propagation-domain-containing protein [Hypoxylon sp. FL1857]
MEHTDNQISVIPTISGPRMSQFQREFESLTLRIDKRQNEASVKQRFFWVIKDKEKFNGLVQQLSDFVGKLNVIIPATEGHIDSMTKNDLNGMRNLRQVQLVLEAAKEFETSIVYLAQEDITKRCRERVLDRLWYRMIDDRRNNIAEAHMKTLQWVLDPPKPGVEWDGLSEWLRSGSDIYWISGKPGSGKSTLMKFLYQHSQTHALLREWAGESYLVVTSFFFWHLGAPEQKTHEGLSRGLLYYVLSADPSLIPSLLPDMWREAQRSDKADLNLPSASEVDYAFSGLKGEDVKDKFCFFIDGLDEYAGSHTAAARFVKNLVTKGNIKVLVSSRPITACHQAFSMKKKLQLQDLTRNDIKSYVYDNLSSHPHTQELMDMNPDSMNGILADLVNKASGVFLWVVLACRSLLEGFAAFDYLDELQRRVDELPPELESLFEHTLKRIEPRYQEQAAKLLRICYQRRLYPEVEGHTRNKCRIEEGVYTLGLALVDEYGLDTTKTPDFRALSIVQRRMKCRVLEARLRSRCCGLLEIHRAEGQFERCFCSHEGGGDKLDELVDSMVEFMHRSVFEFLNNPAVWNLGCLKISDPNFEPNGVLSRMCLHLVSMSFKERDEDLVETQVNQLSRESLICAKQADLAFSNSTVLILPCLSKLTLDIANSLRSRPPRPDSYPFFRKIGNRFKSSKDAESRLALLLGVELGMINVVKHWESLGMLKRGYGYPLLYHAIDRPYTGWLPSFGFYISPEMISFLLDKGCNPNGVFSDSAKQKTTPWILWLRIMQTAIDQDLALLSAEITELFLAAGADVEIPTSELGETVDSLIERRFIGSIRRGMNVEFELGLTRTQRSIIARCDSILQIIASRRAEPAKMDTNEPGCVAPDSPGSGANKRRLSKSALIGEPGLDDADEQSMKRRRFIGKGMIT